MIKRFFEWIRVKQKIHKFSKGPQFFKEGDIWWCAVGENVGIEINGKGDVFSRPVFIYKKLSRNGFMGLPLSNKNKNGSWYVSINFKNRIQSINLAQAKVISIYRMYEKMGSLDDIQIDKIKSGFLRLYS